MAIAEAVAERLKGRAGNPKIKANSGNISGITDKGETRDLAAAKAGFGSGKTLEAAQAVIDLRHPAMAQICSIRHRRTNLPTFCDLPVKARRLDFGCPTWCPPNGCIPDDADNVSGLMDRTGCRTNWLTDTLTDKPQKRLLALHSK